MTGTDEADMPYFIVDFTQEIISFIDTRHKNYGDTILNSENYGDTILNSGDVIYLSWIIRIKYGVPVFLMLFFFPFAFLSALALGSVMVKIVLVFQGHELF